MPASVVGTAALVIGHMLLDGIEKKGPSQSEGEPKLNQIDHVTSKQILDITGDWNGD